MIMNPCNPDIEQAKRSGKSQQQTRKMVSDEPKIVSTRPKQYSQQQEMVSDGPKIVSTRPEQYSSQQEMVNDEPTIVSTRPKQYSSQQEIEAYLKFLQPSLTEQPQLNIDKIPLQTLNLYDIRMPSVLNPSFLAKRTNPKLNSIYTEYVGETQAGEVSIYKVIVKRFEMTIRVLNLDRSTANQQQCAYWRIGRGSFGQVRRFKAGNLDFAIKQIKFQNSINSFFPINRANSRQIKYAVQQYAFNKLFSMFNVGPSVIFDGAYDLICYDDCIQFQMELCQSFLQEARVYEYKDYQQQLKRCVRTLHELNIVHRDIRCQKILFSPIKNRLVLTGFGQANYVHEALNEKTLTHFAGTPSHCSHQMMELLFKGYGKKGYVNLYYNDMYSLRKMLSIIHKEGQKRQKNRGSQQCSEELQSFILPGNSSGNQSERAEDESFQIERSSGQISQDMIVNQRSKRQQIMISESQNQFSYNQETKLNYYLSKALYLIQLKKHPYQNQVTHKTIKEWIRVTYPDQPHRLQSQLIDQLTSIIQKTQIPSQAAKLLVKNSLRHYPLNSELLQGSIRAYLKIIPSNDRKIYQNLLKLIIQKRERLSNLDLDKFEEERAYL